MFSYHQEVVAGVYIDSSFGRGTVASAAKSLLDQMRSSQATPMAAQLCGAPDRTGRHAFGFVLDLTENVTAVQNAVHSWSQAKCATSFESTTELKEVSVVEDEAVLGPFDGVPRSNGTISDSTTIIQWAFADINTNDWAVKIRDNFKQRHKSKTSSLGGAKKSSPLATGDTQLSLACFVSDMPKAVKQMQENICQASAFDFVDAVAMRIFMAQEAVGAI
ncbi:hypothetical protein MAPG_07263 [Magnaporthiopsis poae ATCC 64411]|uniref:Uncharacterized protein n=1 Tax=Magnaporthiopsis poae (strain ATCC 64411 / 73-15) TaxID=644358 RepID=A0A0C4E474_MAGP6|nr:hypothetical protein MAPG_07263 [Magnaporthiopsis poae ATCC 64411]